MKSNTVFLDLLYGLVMQISLGKLNQLVMVADTGSFSKAAAQLNLSQPALSRSVAGLEERYGVRIFNRVGHGIVLTASGRQIISEARSLLRGMRIFDKNLHLYGSGDAGELMLGLGPLLASQALSGLVGHLFARSANIRVHSLIRPAPILLKALQADQIEIFFAPKTQLVSAPGVTLCDIGSFKTCFVVRRDHPLVGRSMLSGDELSRYPLAAAVELSAFAGEARVPAFICDNFHILREAVIRNDFVWLCSTAFVAKDVSDGDLVELEVEGFGVEDSFVVAATLDGRVLSPLAQSAQAYMTDQLSR